ncbi:hypothetical protein MKQ70_00745 [Chitinophaga sedimenti]|nr:hypothetical protein [Chitinophaga sedimenti]
MIKAFLFDFNGTMINDMEYHTIAWFDIITRELQHKISREAVRNEMYGKNNDVLNRIFGHAHFSEEEMNRISLEKERRYGGLRTLCSVDSRSGPFPGYCAP